MSFESLQAGLVGVIAALPVMSLRRSQWDAQALSNSPVLEEMINRKADDLGPIITGLSRPQLAAVIVTDTVTILELMLVALMGCIDSSLGLYTRIAEKNLGVDIPDLLPFAVALGVSSGLYGLWHFAATTVSEDEAVSIIHDEYDEIYAPGHFQTAVTKSVAVLVQTPEVLHNLAS